MRAVQTVHFEGAERTILAEAARCLSASMEEEELQAEDGQAAVRGARSLATDATPATLKRIAAVFEIYRLAVDRLRQQADVQFWLDQIPEEDRGKDYSASPNMAPEYMADVLAQARGEQAETVAAALDLLDAAKDLATPVPAYEPPRGG